LAARLGGRIGPKAWVKVSSDAIAGWIVNDFPSLTDLLAAVNKKAVTLIKTRFGGAFAGQGANIFAEAASIFDGIGLGHVDALENRWLI
jgi:hypothetical protein